MNRLTPALLAITLLLPNLAHADDASKHAKVIEMIRVTKMEETMTKMMEETKSQINELIAADTDPELAPAQAAIMKDFQAKVSALMLATLNFEKVRPDLIKFYEATYTESELDGILAFYKTPAGIAMLTKTPDLMTKVMNLPQDRMAELAPQVEKLTDDMQRQMLATQPKPVIGPEPPPPAATAPATPAMPSEQAAPPAK